MNQIVLASTNAGKIKEVQSLLQPFAFEIIPQSQLNIEEVPEDGLTFIENALIKARHASQKANLPSLSDDSGLVVPALGGEPGIYSARYAGKDASSKECIEKLLANLKGVPEDQRQAYFYCILVLMRAPDDPCPIVCEGIWRGKILHEPQGSHGFGYDPIFYDPNTQSSAAQLPADKKNQLSHRGQAMAKLLEKCRLGF